MRGGLDGHLFPKFYSILCACLNEYFLLGDILTWAARKPQYIDLHSTPFPTIIIYLARTATIRVIETGRL